ncbi:Vegetative incompatibility protein HET-E-1 [Fusarium oxysporum f. sp. cubense race 1]|uniref:Vegetative incompatibility protein HET-E-1 n=1 Tax=Fusarium oxysporum f. sp. cubense (strain race 1) TaxID=1229664 RepID=N4UKC2_FUSC1|nr:Vegetative incompatibility protein HET-E-1 [Fusarium oxysporum f. sp. cubense race 1]
MRLINTRTRVFEGFYGSKVPKYAILSHTWGQEEVTFQDWADPTSVIQKSGFTKIIEASELTEAINSMFAWYSKADICYAYLSDVPTFKPISYAKEFRQSRWFKRGWTLQELLAPDCVVFYAADWSRIGTRCTLVRDIAEATGIGIRYLSSDPKTATTTQENWSEVRSPVCYEASIAEIMSWLSHRETTRIEDMAYCMLGIFGIHMPLVYGEGPRAFLRLQEEILKISDDHSLFCWSWATSENQGSLLATRPHSFLEASAYQQSEISGLGMENPLSREAFQTFEKILSNPDYATKINDSGPEDIVYQSAADTVSSGRLLKIYNTNAQIVLFTDAGSQLLGTFC